MTLLRRCAAAILALSLLPAAPALAQGAYPTKPIRLVVPFTPGAGTDTVARFVAQKLSERLGQQVVVENRTGAGGAIGAAEVAKAEPDGYTLLFVASPFTTVAAASKSPGYDPVGLPCRSRRSRRGACVRRNLAVPATTMREFVELARREPGKLNYASSGIGSSNQFATEMLKAATGTFVVHVPYRGMAPAATGLIAGRDDSSILAACRCGGLRVRVCRHSPK
jgi:tripartite-type tricarboxylate transporter receptor subunit TctC